jgi:hypothetical protein
MSQVTLSDIKTKQSELEKMIALFSKPITEYIFPETEITLNSGERYAGLILGKDGESSYHLILLDGHQSDINWTNALTWAKEQGGELPNRREQALLYANLKEEFEESWYWSNEQHATYSDSALYQSFYYDGQYGGSKNSELRARAVRRLVIQ